MTTTLPDRPAISCWPAPLDGEAVVLISEIEFPAFLGWKVHAAKGSSSISGGLVREGAPALMPRERTAFAMARSRRAKGSRAGFRSSSSQVLRQAAPSR